VVNPSSFGANAQPQKEGLIIEDAGLRPVSIVITTYNHARFLAEAIESARGQTVTPAEVIVVDDGSTDDTAKLVQTLQSVHPALRLIQHESNRGYGEALHTGFSAGRLEYVFFTDSDNQFDMDELPLLLEWADNSDVVAGYRKVRQDPKMRLLNAWMWNRLVRFLFYVPVRDIDCAFKLFRRSALANVNIESRGAMINTEIMVKLARAGWRIVEVGVTHLPRRAGEPQGARFKVIARAFAEIARMYPHLSALSLSDHSSLASVRGPAPLADDGRWNGRSEDLALTGQT
jgi:glycosyltransferase involved in cell wall biosynthesis